MVTFWIQSCIKLYITSHQSTESAREGTKVDNYFYSVQNGTEQNHGASIDVVFTPYQWRHFSLKLIVGDNDSARIIASETVLLEDSNKVSIM